MKGDSPFRFLAPERLVIEHGPVSLVAEATWSGEARPSLLAKGGLVVLERIKELSEERAILSIDARRIRNGAGLSSVGRRMWEATLPYHDRFATALIAVAGAVSDDLADHLVAEGATRVLVNNGGDVAVRLCPGETVHVGVAPSLSAPPTLRFPLSSEDGVGGVATSGLGGRSFTLGVADAVTVIAATAAQADVAATLVANEVDVDSPAVERVLAEEVYPETDLRGMWVTRSRGALTADEVNLALDRGAAAAREFLGRGLIRGALLFCQGERRHIGFPAPERLEALYAPTDSGFDNFLRGGGRWRFARS